MMTKTKILEKEIKQKVGEGENMKAAGTMVEGGYSIYNKVCPNCQRINSDSAEFCWHCEYEFISEVHHEHEKKRDVGLIVIMSIVILAAVGLILYSLYNAYLTH